MGRCLRLARALRMLPPPVPAITGVAAAPAAETPSRLAAAQMFDLAGQLTAAGDTAGSLALYRALTRDTRVEVRAEARFRMGQLLITLGRLNEAAVAYRAVLDEQPKAARVRLELAALLARMGQDFAARHELRLAQAGGLPPAVAAVVEQIATALRATKPIGGTLSLALAPDTNVNRATRARTVASVIAPLTLSDDARERSGIGLSLAGQVYARLRLTSRVTMVLRASGQGDVYRQHAFDDVSTTVLAGPSWETERDRVSLSAGLARRFYGGDLYTRSAVVEADWLHALGKRAQLELGASTSRTRYPIAPAQSGAVYAVTARYERALSSRFALSIAPTVVRQTAVDPGYANWSGGATVLASRQWGRATCFASLGVRRLVADEALFLFETARREWFSRAEAGASLRALTVFGFAPLVRVAYERNRSTVALYDYHRVVGSLGVVRAF